MGPSTQEQSVLLQRAPILLYFSSFDFMHSLTFTALHIYSSQWSCCTLRKTIKKYKWSLNKRSRFQLKCPRSIGRNSWNLPIIPFKPLLFLLLLLSSRTKCVPRFSYEKVLDPYFTHTSSNSCPRISHNFACNEKRNNRPLDKMENLNLNLFFKQNSIWMSVACIEPSALRNDTLCLWGKLILITLTQRPKEVSRI